MKQAELEKEIGRGKDILSRIVGETSDFLAGFDSLGPAEMRAFEERRRQLLEELVAFLSALRQKLKGREKGLPPEMAQMLDEFKIFQEVFVQIIMEKNAAIIARAGQSLDRLRAELNAVGLGRQAMRGYNRKSDHSWKSMEKTA